MVYGKVYSNYNQQKRGGASVFKDCRRYSLYIFGNRMTNSPQDTVKRQGQLDRS